MKTWRRSAFFPDRNNTFKRSPYQTTSRLVWKKPKAQYPSRTLLRHVQRKKSTTSLVDRGWGISLLTLSRTKTNLTTLMRVVRGCTNNANTQTTHSSKSEECSSGTRRSTYSLRDQQKRNSCIKTCGNSRCRARTNEETQFLNIELSRRMIATHLISDLIEIREWFWFTLKLYKHS